MLQKKSFFLKLTKDEIKDSGMALALIFLLAGILVHRALLIKLAAVALVLDMIYPRLFLPFAVLWLGLSHLMGTIVSKLILTVIFFLVVTPVGMIRRTLKMDSLKIRKFKRGTESVMVDRNVCFTKNDIERPF